LDQDYDFVMALTDGPVKSRLSIFVFLLCIRPTFEQLLGYISMAPRRSPM